MSSKHLKIIFGTAGIARSSDSEVQEFWKILKAHKVTNLDTAHIYTGSQEALNKLDAHRDFTIDTKAPGFTAGALSKDSVASAGSNSHDLLKEIDVYYLHSPDHSTPLDETLAAIDALYKKGVFKRFGLSNFKPEEVQEIYDLAKSKGYVLPTVYQGNYNAVARLQENTLFPVLRKLGIEFYAYSPIAGGFLAKKPENFGIAGKEGMGRFDPAVPGVNQMYNKIYNKPSLLKALALFHSLAEKHSLSSPEVAYRWIAHHSSLDAAHGDGVILGASRPSQLESTLEWIEKGPLDPEVVKGIDEVWDIAKEGNVIDNFISVQ